MTGSSLRARWWAALRRLAGVFHRRTDDAEMDEEMRFHLDMLAERYARGGLPRDEARRAALVQFGGREQWREAGRDELRSRVLDDLARDLRYGAGALRRHPGFAVTTILTVALGIAASVAVFTIADAVFYRRLPVPGAERIVRIYFRSARTTAYEGMLGYQATRYVAEHARTLALVTAHYSTAPLYVDIGGDHRELQGAVVSASYFSLLAVKAQLGRVFLPAEDSVPDRDAVAVISDGLWRTEFGGDPRVLGRTIGVNGRAFTIVGVMPAQFHGALPGSMPNDVWIPTMMLRLGYRWCDALDVTAHCGVGEGMARLADGHSLVDANAEIGAMSRALIDLNDPTDTLRSAIVATAAGFAPGNQQNFVALVKLLGVIAGTLLLLACANVTGLLLARGVARTREIAVRMSLGAARGRIVRQLLAESFLLAVIGGAAGVALSLAITRALMAVFRSDSEGYVRYFDLSLDARTLAFAAVTSLATVFLVGLLPAVQSSRSDPAELIKGGAIRRGHARLRSALVVAQVALSLALVTGALLLGRSFSFVTGGASFDARHVALLRLRPRLVSYAPDSAQRFLRRVVERLRAVPDVESLVLARGVGSVWESTGSIPVALPGDAPRAPDKQTLIDYHEVTPGLFATIRVPILAGRDFAEGDSSGTPRVAIVNEALARRFWPTASAVGQAVLLGGKSVRVVGVARDHQLHDAGTGPTAMAFVPFWQNDFQPQVDARVAVRVRGDPSAALSVLRRAIAAVDPNIPITEAMPMTGQVAGSYSLVDVASRVATASAVVALFLSALGLYGVIAFVVARSTRDIGIRIAVGAHPRQLAALYVRQGLTTTLLGAIIGLALALSTTRLLAHWLFGVGTFDALAFAGATAAVAVVGLVAAYLPARRAARVDPTVAMRAE